MGFFSGFNSGFAKSWANDDKAFKALGNIFSKQGVGLLERFGYGLGRISSPTTLAIGGAITAGVVGTAAYIGMTPRGREFKHDDRQIAQIPPMLTPQDLMRMQAPQMAMESGPAEGRGDFDFRNMVNASKGRSLEGVNASQPNIDPSLAVQQL